MPIYTIENLAFFIDSFQPISEFDVLDFQELIADYSKDERELLINFLDIERLKHFDYKRIIASFSECYTTKDIFCVYSCPLGLNRGVFIIYSANASTEKIKMTHDEALQSADQLLDCFDIERTEVTKPIFSALVNLFTTFSVNDEICVLFPHELFKFEA